MSFNGKRVLITGGAMGLGRATVQKFHDAGATVVVLDKNGEGLEKLKKEIPTVTTVQVDLLDWEATRIAIEENGPFDHLVNNAGIVRVAQFMDIEEKDVDLIFGVNFKAYLNVAQIFAKGVIAAKIKDASIVNVSSAIDRKCLPGVLTYSCTKAAVTMMTKCISKELGPHGIRVNCVRPTAMRTAMFDTCTEVPGDNFDAFAKPFIDVSPIKRECEPSDTAGLILFLSSTAAAMITGEDVAIDGGYSIA